MAIKLKDFLDNKAELATGAVIGFAPVFIIGFTWACVAAILCAILYRLGGVTGGDRYFRRIGPSAVISAALFFTTWQWVALVPIATWWAIFALGYGLPDGEDKGSFLGRFFLNVTQQNRILSNILTHTTISFLLALTLVPFLPLWGFGVLMFWFIIFIGTVVINATA